LFHKKIAGRLAFFRGHELTAGEVGQADDRFFAVRVACLDRVVAPDRVVGSFLERLFVAYDPFQCAVGRRVGLAISDGEDDVGGEVVQPFLPQGTSELKYGLAWFDLVEARCPERNEIRGQRPVHERTEVEGRFDVAVDESEQGVDLAGVDGTVAGPFRVPVDVAIRSMGLSGFLLTAGVETERDQPVGLFQAPFGTVEKSPSPFQFRVVAVKLFDLADSIIKKLVNEVHQPRKVSIRSL
jgi:hypothetical protein